MANSTGSAGGPAEPALIYDAGERRTHEEHAAEAYDFAQRADALDDLGKPASANRARASAQFHATMAVYEAFLAL